MMKIFSKKEMYWIGLPLLAILLVHCSSAPKEASNPHLQKGITKRVIIYKTRYNYYNFVPITMNKEKTEIMSYPAKEDLILDSMFTLPVPLEGGYMLDKRGINSQSAFLNMPYLEYYQMKELPRVDSLLSMIKDSDPFEEIYDCGSITDYSDVVKELNQKIKEKDFSKFLKIKVRTNEKDD